MSELLDRAVQILEILAAGERVTVREVAAHAGLPKSTVHRLLQDLVDLRLVQVNGQERHYQLGSRMLELGVAYQRQHRGDLLQLSVGPMTTLRDQTGETVGLTVLPPNAQAVVHLLEIRGTSELSLSFRIGHPVPLWGGSPSRLFLTEFSDAAVAQIAHNRSESVTQPDNPLPAEELIRLVQKARTDKFAMAFSENVAGVNTFSVPVYDLGGATMATISVTGMTERLPKERMMLLLPQALLAAGEITRLIGTAGPRTSDAEGEKP